MFGPPRHPSCVVLGMRLTPPPRSSGRLHRPAGQLGVHGGAPGLGRLLRGLLHSVGAAGVMMSKLDMLAVLLEG